MKALQRVSINALRGGGVADWLGRWTCKVQVGYKSLSPTTWICFNGSPGFIVSFMPLKYQGKTMVLGYHRVHQEPSEIKGVIRKGRHRKYCPTDNNYY